MIRIVRKILLILAVTSVSVSALAVQVSPTLYPSAGEVRVVLKAIKKGKISDSSYVTDSGGYKLHLRDLSGSTISSNIPMIREWLSFWDHKYHQDAVLLFKGNEGLPDVSAWLIHPATKLVDMGKKGEYKAYCLFYRGNKDHMAHAVALCNIS